MSRWQVVSLLSAALIAAPIAAANPSITVSQHQCGAVVTIDARNVPLSRVLDELAQALSFRVSVAAEADRNVTVSLSGSARDVITALTRHDNVMYVERLDSACDGQRYPVRLSVLEGRTGTPGEYILTTQQVTPDPELTMVPPRLTRLARQRADGKDGADNQRSGRGLPRRQRE